MGSIRDSWDYLLVYPQVQNYLQDRGFPFFISCTRIQDYLEKVPELENQRIVRIEWDIAHALNEFGYRRVSNNGAGFVRTCLGLETVPEPAQFRELAVLVV